MSSERFFMEISGPTGRLVRLGDTFVNCQGIELTVSSICRPLDCEDIFLGLAPVSTLLNGGNWYNEILMDCEEPGVLANRIYSECPSIRLDNLDKMRAVEDFPLDRRIVA